MRVSIQSPERLMDNTLDPAGRIPEGQYRMECNRLPPGATVRATIQYGGETWIREATAGPDGNLSFNRSLSDPRQVATDALNAFGSASWDIDDTQAHVSAGGVSIDIEVLP